MNGEHFVGHQKIKELVQGIRKKLNIDSYPPDPQGRRFGPMRHIVSGLVIDRNGNTAISESYWILFTLKR